MRRFHCFFEDCGPWTAAGGRRIASKISEHSQDVRVGQRIASWSKIRGLRKTAFTEETCDRRESVWKKPAPGLEAGASPGALIDNCKRVLKKGRKPYKGCGNPREAKKGSLPADQCPLAPGGGRFLNRKHHGKRKLRADAVAREETFGSRGGRSFRLQDGKRKAICAGANDTELGLRRILRARISGACSGACRGVGIRIVRHQHRGIISTEGGEGAPFGRSEGNVWALGREGSESTASRNSPEIKYLCIGGSKRKFHKRMKSSPCRAKGNRHRRGGQPPQGAHRAVGSAIPPGNFPRRGAFVAIGALPKSESTQTAKQTRDPPSGNGRVSFVGDFDEEQNGASG